MKSFNALVAAVGKIWPPTPFYQFKGMTSTWLQVVSAKDMVKGKKVVLFAVPGAFTPTCSLKHLPSFIENADKLKAKGVDTIACIAVNDAFVMQASHRFVGLQIHDLVQGSRPIGL